MNSRDSVLKIFLVEDHPDTLLSLRRYLERLGHEVRCASRMEEALEKLPSCDCDVLLSDIGLPDGDGWEMLRRANLPASIFTVAISGFGTMMDRTRSHEAGFRRHLLKPFDPRDLDICLREAAREKSDWTRRQQGLQGEAAG